MPVPCLGQAGDPAEALAKADPLRQARRRLDTGQAFLPDSSSRLLGFGGPTVAAAEGRAQRRWARCAERSHDLIRPDPGARRVRHGAQFTRCRPGTRHPSPGGRTTYNESVTPDDERAYVQKWAETGRQLEAIRWRELRELEPAAALRASEALISAAVLVPIPQRRRVWSGLVDLQVLLHSRTRA